MFNQRLIIRLAILVAFFSLRVVAADDGSLQPFSAEETSLINTVELDNDVAARRAALRLLGAKHDDRFLDVISDALNDSAVQLQETAMKAIGDMTTPSSVAKLEEVAGDSERGLLVRLLANERLGAIAQQRGTESAISALIALTHSSDSDVSKDASQLLTKAIHGCESSKLMHLTFSATDSVRTLASAEQARRGVSANSARTDNERTPISEKAFTPADLKILNEWRRSQLEPIQRQIQNQRRLLDRYKPTNPYRNQIRKGMITLGASIGRLNGLSPAEVGVAMINKAKALDGRALSSYITSKMLGAVSKDILDRPGNVYEDQYGRFYQEDNSSPGILGMLFAVVARANAERARASAQHIVDLLQSLSQNAQDAIKTRYDREARSDSSR